jgi:hypothetical protein
LKPINEDDIMGAPNGYIKKRKEIKDNMKGAMSGANSPKSAHSGASRLSGAV